MLVREIELENFLSHQKETISLPEEGIFLLSGESGSGKSSIVIDAIAYTLFGAVATRSRKQELLVNRDSGSEPMSVRVLFQLDNTEELIVARGVSNGRSSGAWAKAYEPDPADPTQSVLLADGATAVARLLRRKLGGMSWRQFYAAFVARQSEIALLTTKTGAERKKLIQRMLGMRELEKSGDLISAGLRRAQAEVDQLEFSLGGKDLDSLTRELSDARSRSEAAAERVSATEREISSNAEKIEQLEAKLSPLREAAKSAERAKSLETEQELWRGRAEAAEAAEKAKSELSSSEAAVSEKEELVESLREQYQKAAAELRESEERERLQAGLAEALAGAPESYRELTSEDYSARKAELESQKKTASQRAADASERLQRLRESGDCYVCGREFESEDERCGVLDELQGEIQEAEESASEAASELESLAGARGSLDQLWEIRRELSQLPEAAPALSREELTELAERGVSERDALAGLQKQLARVQSEAEAAGEWDGASERLREIEAELSGLTAAGSEGERMSELEGELAELVRETEQLKGSLPEIKLARERAASELREAELSLKGLEHETESLEGLRSRALSYEKAQTLLRGYQQHLAQEIRPALEEIGSEMLQQISSGKMRALKIGEDSYEVEVEFSSGYTIPASMLSGGEEIRTNLCLRLALTRLVSQRTGVPVGFLVLDEPLPSQDPGHIDRILELLRSLQPFYRQQFIISHVGDLRNADAIDHVIELDESAAVGSRVSLIPA